MEFEMPDQSSSLIRSVNVYEQELRPERAHDGDGEVFAVRLAPGEHFAGECHFIDYVELPPGASIGDHRHAVDEEEFYLVLAGSGTMRLDGDRFPVRAGDLVRNRPGGFHGLANTGPDVIRLFVFEIAVTQGGAPR